MKIFYLTSQERKALIFICGLLLLGGSVTYISKKNPAWLEKVRGQVSPSPKQLRININQAGRDELIKLPGVGGVLARRIIEYRNQRGVFSSIDELIKVKGIGDKKLEKIKKHIYLN